MPASIPAATRLPVTDERGSVMEPLTVTLSKAKETKNTVRYETDVEGAAVTTLYVQKDAVEKAELGDSITVTLSAS